MPPRVAALIPLTVRCARKTFSVWNEWKRTSTLL
nr:MAG TPA: hypothetical protein [Caudoviricetes sp.]